MAIQTNYDMYGVIIPNAYIRIDHITGGKRDGWSGVAYVYKNKESFENKERHIDHVLLPVPPLDQDIIDETGKVIARKGDAISVEEFSGNAYEVVYTRLKTKFPDSVDV